MRELNTIMLIFVMGVVMSQYNVKGILYLDSIRETEEFLVELESKDNQLTNSLIVKPNEEFVFEQILIGEYSFSVNGVFYKKIKLINENINLGSISLLDEISNELAEVEFVKSKLTFEIEGDRKVVYVGDDFSSTGASLDDIMSIAPGVQIQNQRVFLRGNESKIYIDDRLTNQSYTDIINSVDPSQINRIEIINNPSSKYSAEGTAGIINIILKKNHSNGFNALFSTDFEYVDDQPWHYIKGSTNYNFGKFNISAFSNYDVRKTAKDLLQDREDVYYDTRKLYDSKRNLNRLGFDYFIDDKNSISTEFTYTNIDVGVDTSIDSLSKESLMNTRYMQLDESKFKKYSSQFAYERKFEKVGHEIDFEIYYQLDDDSEYIDYFYNTTYSSSRLDTENTLRFNIDYVNPFSKNVNLELGGEALFYGLDEDFTIRDENLDLDFERNIIGIYGLYEHVFNRLSYQVGLRMEFTEINSVTPEESFSNNYMNFFPSIFLQYDLDSNSELQLNYSRRIERPSSNLFRPIREEFITYTLLGNNHLKPQLTDNIELGYYYSMKKLNLGTSLYYRFIKDEIGSNRYLDENGSMVVYQRINMGDKNEYGTELTMNYKIYNWWDLSSTLNFYFYKRQGFIENEFDEVEDNRLDLQMYNNFKFFKGFKVGVEANYHSEYDDFSGTFDDVSKVNITAKKMLMNKRMVISMRVNDIFDTSVQSYNQIRPIVSYDTERFVNQKLKLSLLYKFASGKNIKNINLKTRNLNTTEGIGQ